MYIICFSWPWLVCSRVWRWLVGVALCPEAQTLVPVPVFNRSPEGPAHIVGARNEVLSTSCPGLEDVQQVQPVREFPWLSSFRGFVKFHNS